MPVDSQVIFKIEVCKRRDVYGFKAVDEEFVKIWTYHPKYRKQLSSILE